MRERKELKAVPFDQRFIDYCSKYPEAADMLKRVSDKPTTKGAYGRGVSLFAEFLQKNPTQIVNEYKADAKAGFYDATDKWERTFRNFTEFLSKRFGSGTVAIYFAGAKALLNYSVPRSMRLQTETPEVQNRVIPAISFDELKKVYSMCDVRERACISVLKDSGISCDDAVLLTLRDLESFNESAQWAHINVVRGKENVRYETFLGPNALDDLRAYLSLREKAGETITPETPVFGTNHKPYKALDKASLVAVFKGVKKRTGIPISTHRLRKFFETYVALVARHPIVVKYWTGHKIAGDIESHYIIPPTPEQLKLYQEAYKNLDLTGGTLEERARQAAKEQFDAMLTPEQKAILAKSGLQVRESGKRKAKKTNCEDGEHCQRIVTEENLAGFLADGYKVVAALPSGKIVIDKS